MSRILKLLACAALLSASSAFAQARTATSTFDVTATVARTCTVSAVSVTLPDYDSTAGTMSEGTTTVNVACTNHTPYTVTLSSTGNLWQLRPSSGADRLNYEIYSSLSPLTRWNETTAVSGQGIGHTANHHVAHIRVPANQDAGEGTYTDTVTMTVTY